MIIACPTRSNFSVALVFIKLDASMRGEKMQLRYRFKWDYTIFILLSY